MGKREMYPNQIRNWPRCNPARLIGKMGAMSGEICRAETSAMVSASRAEDQYHTK